MGYEPSDDCLQGLGVNVGLNLDTTVQMLQQAPQIWEDRQPAEVRRKIIGHLDQLQVELPTESEERQEQIRSQLTDAPFLYFEEAEPSFRTPETTVIRGSGLGEYLIALDEVYSKHAELLAQLGAHEKVSAETCLEYLATTDWADRDEERSKVWRRTVELLRGMYRDLSVEQFQRELAVTQLRERACLPTLAGSLVPLDELQYFVHDDSLCDRLDESKLQATVVQPARSRRLNNEALARMWEELGLARLEGAASLKLAEPLPVDLDTKSSSPVTEDENLRQLLQVAHSYLVDQDAPEEAHAVLAHLRTYNVRTVSAITGQYMLDGRVISPSFSLECFIDDQTDRILRTPDVGAEYSFTRQLPERLPLRERQRDILQELLAGALGKQQPHLVRYLADQGVDLVEIGTEQKATQADGTLDTTTTDEDDSHRPTSSADREVPGPDEHSGEEGEGNETSRGSQAPQPQASARPHETEDDTETASTAGGTRASSTPPHEGTATGADKRRERSAPLSGDKSAKHEEEDQANGGESAEQPKESRKFEQEISPGAAAAEGVVVSQREPKTHSGGGGGGGGGGGRTTGERSNAGGVAAGELGLWGEELVMCLLVDAVRTAVSSDEDAHTETWRWDAEFDEELLGLTRAGTVSIEDGGFDHPPLKKPIPGVAIQVTVAGEQQEVKILHVRDANLGADILVAGAALAEEPAAGDPLSISAVSPSEAAWIEVKASAGHGTTFTLTPAEYARAEQERERYHVVRVVNAGTRDVGIGTVLTDLVALEEAGEIEIESKELGVRYS